MRLLQNAFFALTVLALPLTAGSLAVVIPTDAHASVMIAVPFEALVKDADAVAVVVPQEARSVWEGGRIYTYTRVKLDRGIAGDAGDADVWIRTMGGVVGEIGQLVDGEPVLTANKPALLFLRKFKAEGTWEVSARAQGQYPVVVDEAKKTTRVIRSANMGVLLPPKKAPVVVEGSVQPQSQSQVAASVSKIRLASDVIHDRPLDEVAKEIASTWKRLHARPAPATK